jgi:hypothetical protein
MVITGALPNEPAEVVPVPPLVDAPVDPVVVLPDVPPVVPVEVPDVLVEPTVPPAAAEPKLTLTPSVSGP